MFINQLKSDRIRSLFLYAKSFIFVNMKGEKLLYADMVKTSLPETKGTFQKQHVYLEARHDVMAARYYYHSSICRMRYDDCLLQLSREFNLTTNTIVICLKLRLYKLNGMVENETTLQELKAAYPWFLWDGKPSLSHQN